MRISEERGKMVKGVGVDIVEIRRIEDCIAGYRDHFLEKVFTAEEIRYCNRKKCPSVHFAGRWAAKEAFFKALPYSCQRHASWKSIQITAAEGGRPAVDIIDAAFGKRVVNASISRFHLSISHERSFCAAFVIAE